MPVSRGSRTVVTTEITSLHILPTSYPRNLQSGYVASIGRGTCGLNPDGEGALKR